MTWEGASMTQKRATTSVKVRRVAAALRRWREDADLQLREAAARAGVDFTRLSRLERGVYRVPAEDVRRLAAAYEVGDDEAVDAVAAAAAIPPGTGWWAPYAGLVGQSYLDYTELEADAVQIRMFHPVIVPGLLQAPGYARALLARSVKDVGSDRMELLVALRMGRQQVLTRTAPPATLHAVVPESALHAEIGDGPLVMRDQVRHLLELSERKNVVVQVLPLSAHPALAANGAYTLLSFGHPWLPVISVDTPTGGSHSEDPAEVAFLQAAFEESADEALPADESRDLLKHHIERLNA